MSAWETVALGDVTERVLSWDPRIKPDSKFTYVDLSAVDNRSKSIISSAEILGCKAPSRARQLIQLDDILVSTVRPNLNAVAAVSEKYDGATASTGFAVLRPTSSVDRTFLFHWVRSQSFVDDMARKATGASYPAVSDRIVKESLLPLPSIPEQRRIASILDEVDVIRAKHRAQLTHLDDLPRVLFHEHARRDVEHAVLNDVATTTSGGTPSRARAEYYGGTIPWVKSGELHSGVINQTEEALTELGLKSSSAKLMPRGTILLAMYGATAGIVGVLGIEAATNQAICCLTPGDRLDAAYLAEFLRASSETLLSQRNGGAQPNLSQSTIRGLKVPLPPIADQKGFAVKAAAVRAERDRVARALEADDELFAALQHRAFRGEL